ncbi:putative AP2 family [Plasmodium knowlesi]|uniref:Putative AP2 family n=1 Tax=Plasmodium knowlesi TaxID=5850 RepID=A0A1Y3DJA0_PLAKN|nr:putative AP2 family [Plasmodium knowlesi]
MEKQSKTESGNDNKEDIYKNYMDEMNVLPSMLQNKNVDSFASNSTIDENKLMNVNDPCNLYLDRNLDKGITKRVAHSQMDMHMEDDDEDDGGGEPKDLNFPGMIRNNPMMDFLNTPIMNENGEPIITNKCLNETRKVVPLPNESFSSHQVDMGEHHLLVKDTSKTNEATSTHTNDFHLPHMNAEISGKDVKEERWIKCNSFIYEPSANYAQKNMREDHPCEVPNDPCKNEENCLHGNGVLHHSSEQNDSVAHSQVHDCYNYRFIKNYVDEMTNKPRSKKNEEELTLGDKSFDVERYLKKGPLPKDDTLRGDSYGIPVFATGEGSTDQTNVQVNVQANALMPVQSHLQGGVENPEPLPNGDNHKKSSTLCGQLNNYGNVSNEESANEVLNKGVERCIDNCKYDLASHSQSINILRNEDSNQLSLQTENESKGEEQNADQVFKNIAMKIQNYLRNYRKKMIIEEGKHLNVGPIHGVAQGSVHHPHAMATTSAGNYMSTCLGSPLSNHMHVYPDHMNNSFATCSLKENANLKGSIKITVPLFLLYITNAYATVDVSGSNTKSAHAMRWKKLKKKIMNEIIFGFTYADADKYVEQLLCNIKKCFIQVLDYLKEYNPQWVCSNGGDAYFYHFRKIMAINSSYVDVNSIVHHVRVLTNMKRKKWTDGAFRGAVMRNGLVSSDPYRKVATPSGNAKSLPIANTLLPNSTNPITMNDENNPSSGCKFYQGVDACGFSEPMNHHVDGNHWVGRSLKRKHSLGEEKNIDGYTHKQIKTETISTDGNCTNNEIMKNENSFIVGTGGSNQEDYAVHRNQYDINEMTCKEGDGLLCREDINDMEDKIYYAPSDMRTSIETVINENGKSDTYKDKYDPKFGLKDFSEGDDEQDEQDEQDKQDKHGQQDEGAQLPEGIETFEQNDTSTLNGDITPVDGARVNGTNPDEPLNINHSHYTEQSEQDSKKEMALCHQEESGKKEKVSIGKEIPNVEDYNGKNPQEKNLTIPIVNSEAVDTNGKEEDTGHTFDAGICTKNEHNNIISSGDGFQLQSSIIPGTDVSPMVETTKDLNVHPTMYDEGAMLKEQCINSSSMEKLKSNDKKTSASNTLNNGEHDSLYQASHFSNGLSQPLAKSNDPIGTIRAVESVGTGMIHVGDLGENPHEKKSHVTETTDSVYMNRHIANGEEHEKENQKLKNKLLSLKKSMKHSIMNLNINKKKKKKKKNLNTLFESRVLSSLSACTMNNIILRLENFKLIEVENGRGMHMNKNMLIRGNLIHTNEKNNCFYCCSPSRCVFDSTRNMNGSIGSMYGDEVVLGGREEKSLPYIQGVMEMGGEKKKVAEGIMAKLNLPHGEAKHIGVMPCSGVVCAKGQSTPFGVQTVPQNNLHDSIGGYQNDSNEQCDHGKGEIIDSSTSGDGICKNQLMEFIREVLIQHGAYINESVELNSNDNDLSRGDVPNDDNHQESRNVDEESCTATENDINGVSEKLQNNELDIANGAKDQLPLDDNSASLKTEAKKQRKFNFIEDKSHNRIYSHASDMGRNCPNGSILSKENFLNLLKWYLSVKVGCGCYNSSVCKSNLNGESHLCDKEGLGSGIMFSGGKAYNIAALNHNSDNHSVPFDAHEKELRKKLHLYSGDNQEQIDLGGEVASPSGDSSKVVDMGKSVEDIKALYYGALPCEYHHEGKKACGNVFNMCTTGNNHLGVSIFKAQCEPYPCRSFDGEATKNGIATIGNRTCEVHQSEGWNDASHLNNSHHCKRNVFIHANNPMCMATQYANHNNVLSTLEKTTCGQVATCTTHNCNGLIQNNLWEEKMKMSGILNDKSVKISTITEHTAGENNDNRSNSCGGRELEKILFGLFKSGECNMDSLAYEKLLFDLNMLQDTNNSKTIRHSVGDNSEMYAGELDGDTTHGEVSNPSNGFCSSAKNPVGGKGNAIDLCNNLAHQRMNKNDEQIVKEEDMNEGPVQGGEKLLKMNDNQFTDVKVAYDNSLDARNTNYPHCGISKSGFMSTTENALTCTEQMNKRNHLLKLYHLYALLEKEKSGNDMDDKIYTDMQNELKKYLAKHDYLFSKEKIDNSFFSCDNIATNKGCEEEGSSGKKLFNDNSRLYNQQLYLLNSQILNSKFDEMQFFSSMEGNNGLLRPLDKGDGNGGCTGESAISNHIGNPISGNVLGETDGTHFIGGTFEEGMYKDNNRTYRNLFLHEQSNQRNEGTRLFHSGNRKTKRTDEDKMNKYLSSLCNPIVYKSGFYPTEGSNHNGAQSSGGSGNIPFNRSSHMNRCTGSRRSSNLCDYMNNLTYSNPNENCSDNVSHVDELGNFLLVHGEHSNSRDVSGGSGRGGSAHLGGVNIGKGGSHNGSCHNGSCHSGSCHGGSCHSRSFAHLYNGVVTSLDHGKTKLCNKHMNNSVGLFSGRNNTDDIILRGYLTRKRREEITENITKKRALIKKIKNAEKMTDEEINKRLMKLSGDPTEIMFLKKFYAHGGGGQDDDDVDDNHHHDDDGDDDNADGSRGGFTLDDGDDHTFNRKKKVHMKNAYLSGNAVRSGRHKDIKSGSNFGNRAGCSVGSGGNHEDDENVSSVESSKLGMKGERGKNVNFFLNNFTVEYGRGRRNKIINQNYMKNYEMETRYYGRRESSTAGGAEGGINGSGSNNTAGGGHGNTNGKASHIDSDHRNGKLNGVCYISNGRNNKDKTKLHLETTATTPVGRGNNTTGKGGMGSRRMNNKVRNNTTVNSNENYEYRMSVSELKPQRGVYFDRSQKAWIGSWYEEGKQIKRRFKIKYYGWDEARNLATKARFAFENRTKHIKGAGKKGASAAAGTTTGTTNTLTNCGVSNDATSSGGNKDGTEGMSGDGSGAYTRTGRKEEDAENHNNNGTNEEGAKHFECGSYVDGTNRRIMSRRGGGTYLRTNNEEQAVESNNAPTSKRDGRRGGTTIHAGNTNRGRTHKMEEENDPLNGKAIGVAGHGGEEDDEEEDEEDHEVLPTGKRKKLRTNNNSTEGRKNDGGSLPCKNSTLVQLGEDKENEKSGSGVPYGDAIKYSDVGGESTNKYETGGREKYGLEHHHIDYEEYHPAYDKKRNLGNRKGEVRGGTCKNEGTYDGYEGKYVSEYKEGDIGLFREWNEFHRVNGGRYEGASRGDYPLSGMSTVDGMNDLDEGRGKARHLSQRNPLRNYDDYYVKGNYPDGKSSAEHATEDEHVPKRKSGNEEYDSCINGGRRKINNNLNSARNSHQDDGQDEDDGDMNYDYKNQTGTNKKDRTNRENHPNATEHKGKNSCTKLLTGKTGDNVITYAKSNNKKSSEANHNQIDNSVILPQGVFYQDSKKAFCANWYSNGKQEKRYFSINKFGEERARNLAIAARKKFEHVYKKNNGVCKKDIHNSSMMKTEDANDISGLDNYDLLEKLHQTNKHNYGNHGGKGGPTHTGKAAADINATMNVALMTTAGMTTTGMTTAGMNGLNLNQGGKCDVGHSSISNPNHEIANVDVMNEHTNMGDNGKVIGGSLPPMTNNEDLQYMQNSYLYRVPVCTGDSRIDEVYKKVMSVTPSSENIRMNVANTNEESSNPPYVTNSNTTKENIKLASSPVGSNSTTDMVNNNSTDCVSNGRGVGGTNFESEALQNDTIISMGAPLSNIPVGERTVKNPKDNEDVDSNPNGLHNGNDIDNSLLGTNNGSSVNVGVNPPFRNNNLFIGPNDVSVAGAEDQNGGNTLYTGVANKTNEMHLYAVANENLSKGLSSEEVNPIGAPFDPNAKEFSTPDYYSGNKQGTKNQLTRSIKKEIDDMNMYNKLEKLDKIDKSNSTPAGVYMIRINGIVQAWRAEWRSPSGCKRTKNFGINTYGTTLSKKLAIEMRARMTGECLVSDDGTVFDYTNKKIPEDSTRE